MKRIIFILSLFLINSISYSYNSDSLVSLKKSTADSADKTYNSAIISDSAVKALPITALECTVTTNSMKIFKNVKLSELSDSTVKIFIGSKTKEIHIKDIRTIDFNQGGFWKGAIDGAAGALVLGLILGLLDSTGAYLWDGIKIGLVLAVPLGIGLGIFYEVKNDGVYDLSKLDFKAKRKKVKLLINKYSVE
jgi:hypothetical protein